MADGLDVNVEGMEELVGRIRALEYDVRYKGGRSALRKAANLVRDAARAHAANLDDPSTPENIAANIAVRFSSRTFKSRGDLEFRVGVMGGATHVAAASGEFKGSGSGNPGGDTFHWRFLEFGTQHMPAKPFLRRALSENIQNATNEFIREYNRAIDRALKRAAKAQGV